MKTKNFLKTCFCLFLVSLSFSCGNGSGDIVDSLIPDLSANWKNVGNNQQDEEYNFFPLNQNVASSTFDGNLHFDGNDLNTFSGSFQNSKINFTINSGSKNGTKYTGKINGNSANATMTLTVSTGGTITLQKH